MNIKNMNKKTLFRVVLGTVAATLVLMILGLIFIGAGKVTFDGGEWIGSMSMNGFDFIRNSSVGEVLSSKSLADSIALFSSTNQLGLIRCGIVFAVIFTPILAAVTVGLGSYYYVKFIKKPVAETVTVEETLIEE